MNVAFIPVRGGSKSIPLKNIKPICGKPLVYWTVKAACECIYIDKVYIATDSIEISETIEKFKNIQKIANFDKVEIIGRSKESASDTASTEFAMLEFADKYEFDNIVLIQATSPLLTASDLERGFNKLAEENTDSVLSVVPQKRFHWKVDKDNIAHAINYDVFHRPRRQEFEGSLVENGAFYITSKKNLLLSQNRVSGKIRVVEMNEDSFFEIDEPSDWIIVEALMKKRQLANSECKKGFPEIKMFLTDCDGCLTDGGMYYSENGDELKKFNTKDGMAFSLLKDKGIITGIITSESVKLNQRRAEKMKVDVLESGCKDKCSAIKRLCEKYGINLENIVYIGDDLNDLDAIQMVGVGCCPSNAISLVREKANYITKAKGGEGVIREVADIVIKW